MGGPVHNYGQVHPEVEDLEQLGLGKGQDDDSSQLCQRDATQHLDENR